MMIGRIKTGIKGLDRILKFSLRKNSLIFIAVTLPNLLIKKFT